MESLTRDQLILLAETSSEVTFFATLDGITTWVSPGVVDMLGWTPGEMVGRPFFDFVHPEDHPAVVQARSTADASGTIRYRARLRRKDGSYRWMDILLRASRDAAGNLIGRYGSWRDANTEVLLQAELRRELTELERARELLRVNMDAVADPLVLLKAVRDPDTGEVADFRYLDVNEATCEYLSLQREDLIGRGILEMAPGQKDSGLFGVYVAAVDADQPVVVDGFQYDNEIIDQTRYYDIRARRVSGDRLSVTWRDVTDAHEAAARLAESEQRYRLLSDNATDMVTLWQDDKLTWASPTMLAFLGLELEQAIGLDARDQVNPADVTQFDEAVDVVRQGKAHLHRERVAGGDGAEHWIEVHAGPYAGPSGEPLGVLTSARVIDDIVAAERALVESEERFRLLASSASEMVGLWRDYMCLWVSPSTLQFLGVELDQVLGMDARCLVAPEDLTRFEEANAAAASGESRIVRLRLAGRDGIQHWVEVHVGPYTDSDGLPGAVLTSSRVIDTLVATEQELDHQARFDLLTGLMNRSEVLRNVARLSNQRPRTGIHTAILFCDIDRFKDINDAHGHAAGDEVLRTLGERLSATIRSDDFAARIGGDELLVVLTGVHSLDEAVTIAEKIRSAASEPVAFERGMRITPSLSIGVTLAHPGETTDTLLERADNAMYEAKRSGRDQVIAIA